ncbi:MAG: DUF3782 domain-containing protein [Blastocatellia bacterium]
MTDQELRDFIAELSLSIAELRKSQQEADEQLRKSQQKTDEQLRKSRQETDEQLRKSQQEADRLIKEAAEEIKESGRQIKQVSKQLGELGNKFGSFAEGMALPSMEKILRDRFNMDVVMPRATSRLNGRTIEIDVMAYDNGSRNELYIVEVKSHLTREGIDQILKTIEEFPKFFGALRDRTVYGIIAAVDIPQNIRAEVLKQGLYLARIHDGEFELLTPKNFKPHAFTAPQEQNGKRKKARAK